MIFHSHYLKLLDLYFHVIVSVILKWQHIDSSFFNQLYVNSYQKFWLLCLLLRYFVNVASSKYTILYKSYTVEDGGKILGYYSFFYTALRMDRGTTPDLSAFLHTGSSTPVSKP